ncbi:MAG TPA: LysR family transcriptional regulator [Ramlibacter sp.]|nr:LysR family transcriptional regulator [Ramlibacter sp.]
MENSPDISNERLARLLRSCHALQGRRGTVNLARIDLAAIRLVVLCAETGSLSAAARLAHLSVSGASHKISFLEESLGAKLFERHRRGLRATRGGQMVASNGRLMLGLMEHLVHNLAHETPQPRINPAAARTT